MKLNPSSNQLEELIAALQRAADRTEDERSRRGRLAREWSQRSTGMLRLATIY